MPLILLLSQPQNLTKSGKAVLLSCKRGLYRVRWVNGFAPFLVTEYLRGRMNVMSNTIINMNRLDILLSRLVGAKFGGLTTATDTKMNKTNGMKGDEKRTNPFHGKVKSVRNISVQFNYDYDGAVDRARVKQDKSPEDWKKGDTWYNAITDDKGRLTAFCEHKTNGEKYIRIRTLHKGKTTYVVAERIETEDGVVYNVGESIPFSELEPFMPKRKAYENQGLEPGTEIAATTLKLTSVRGLRINGQSYEIEHTKLSEPIEFVQTVARFMVDMPNVSAADIPQTEIQTS